MPRVVVCDSIVDLQVAAAELPVRWRGHLESVDGLPEGEDVAAILVGPDRSVTEATLQRLPGLRAIVVTSMGWDHVDVESAKRRNIQIAGVEPYCVEEVAEHTIALIFDLLRGITRLDREVRRGQWDFGRAGRAVRGASLGIVGLGRIGRAVAWRAVALGMVVSAYDPYLDENGDGPDGVRSVPSLEALVARSDVVSVHVPLSPETTTLIDGELLSSFRPGAYLVNVSRGDVIDERALATALSDGRLAGAALDVLAREPPARCDPLVASGATVVTPHAAWYSPEAVARLSGSAGRALARLLAPVPGEAG